MNYIRTFVSFLLVVMLTGCATVPTGPSVMVLPASGKSFEEFQAEDVNCKWWASQQSGLSAQETVNRNTLSGAVVGTVIGAGLGAAIGAISGARSRIVALPQNSLSSEMGGIKVSPVEKIAQEEIEKSLTDTPIQGIDTINHRGKSGCLR